MTDQDLPPQGEDPREVSDAQAEAMASQAELGLQGPSRRPRGDAASAYGDGAQRRLRAVEDESVASTDAADASAADAGPGGDVGGGALLDVEAVAAADPRSKAEILAALTDAEHQLGEAMRERDEYLDHLQRRAAEFDNFRKRTANEKATERAQGRADVVRALVDVLDDFDRTVSSLGPEDAHPNAAEWAANLEAGVRLVHGKLLDALKGLGVERIDQVDVAFDPTRHEAVQNVAADEPVDQPMVAQVLRAGYALDGNVLRAAMVAVRQ